MSESVSRMVEPMPAPNAQLVLWRVSIQAFMAVSGRRKSERFLREMAEKLAAEENLTQVFNIRPSSEAAAVRQARKEAAAVFERWLPIFLAQMPRE